MKKKLSAPNRVFVKGLKLYKFKAFGSKTDIQLSPMINLISGKIAQEKVQFYKH
tara:strand:+ start:424 stop:585 length:162 start_codon:yes stop_codon:yes gene_type:complete